MNIKVLENGFLRDANPAEVAEIEARQKFREPSLVPQSVTMLQARLQLLAAGLLDRANALIAALPGNDGDSARTYWEFAQNVNRYDPLVIVLCSKLDLSELQTDQLFMEAAKR
jgi:hypothetical protein